MNRTELRRSAIPLLIGIIASIAGLLAVNWLRKDRCLDAGGAYDERARRCVLADGGIMDVAYAGDMVTGLVVGVALALMLWRVSTFALRRG